MSSAPSPSPREASDATPPESVWTVVEKLPYWQRLPAAWRRAVRWSLWMFGLVLATFKGADELKLAERWTSWTSPSVRELKGLDRGLEAFSWWVAPNSHDVPKGEAGGDTTRRIDANTIVLLRPPAGEHLGDFTLRFDVPLTALERSIGWSVRTDKGGHGVDFTLELPHGEGAKFLANGAECHPMQAAAGPPVAFLRQRIPAGFRLTVTTVVKQDKVQNTLLLTTTERISHPNEGIPFVCDCEVKHPRPTGWVAFRATATPFQLLNVDLLP